MHKYGFEHEVVIRASEVHSDKKCTLPAMLHIMQEASMQNTLELRLSVWDLAERNVSWVLLRKKLTITERPILGQKVIVRTYPAGFERVFAYRDFFIYDLDGRLMASASSTWTLMNLSSRKIERIPNEFLIFQPEEGTVVLDKPEIKIPKTKKRGRTSSYQVGYYDLDWNGHVNNVTLSRYMLQSTSDDKLFNHEMTEFGIQVKAECLLHERIVAECVEESDNLSMYTLHSESDGRLISEGYAIWQ